MSTGVVTDTGSTISADDRAALRDSITDLIRRRSDSAAVRAAMTRSPRLDAELWATLCTEIGAAVVVRRERVSVSRVPRGIRRPFPQRYP